MKFYAHYYNIFPKGFEFSSMEEYEQQFQHHQNAIGKLGENLKTEWVQLISSNFIDEKLFNLLKIDKSNLPLFIEKANQWSEQDKINLLIAVGEQRCDFDLSKDTPSDFDIEVCDTVNSMQEFAEKLLKDGYLGEIPQSLKPYLDYDEIIADILKEYAVLALYDKLVMYRRK